MNLHGPVRPPESAGPGTATLTVSLDSWKEGHVASTKHTLSVVEPKAKLKPEPVSPRLFRSLIHPDDKASLVTVQFSPDGSKLFTAGYPSGILQFWDVASGKELRRIETPRGYRGSSDYALLTADWSAVYVPWEKLNIVEFEKDGKRDVRYEREGAILAFDVTTGERRPALKPEPKHGVVTAAVFPDGKKVIAIERPSAESRDSARTKRDSTVLWDVRSGTKKTLGHGYPSVAFAKDSHWFALALMSREPLPSVLKLFAADGTELAELATVKSDRFWRPQISPDGKLLAVEQTQGRIDRAASVHVWNLQARKELVKFESGGAFPFAHIAFSPDSNRLAATDYNSAIRLWDIATGTSILEKSYKDRMKPWRVAFSPDGKWLAVSAQPTWDVKENPDPDPSDLPQPQVLLFDLAHVGADPEVVIAPPGYLGGLAFSPDGKLLALGGAGRTHLFDMTGQK